VIFKPRHFTLKSGVHLGGRAKVIKGTCTPNQKFLPTVYSYLQKSKIKT
jgi:hypothetical protein